MHFDVLFLDVGANKYYDRQTLETKPLGGTEASIVRVAEGLASLGLRVAVVQSTPPYFEPVMGQYCFFIHAQDIPTVTTGNFVQIRSVDNAKLFPNAKQFAWFHDVAQESMIDWLPTIKKYNITLIGVSRYHRNSIRDVTENYDKSTYIYNPVPESIYLEREDRPVYDPNLMVWMSSPHKGLGKALELFKKIKSQNDKMQLVVFNPGYLQVELITDPGVVYYGPVNPHTLWQVVKRALCVFYPTQFVETFGCVAAEANALGTPLLTSHLGGLKESVSSDVQFAETDEEVVQKALSWSQGYRPTVFGKSEFKLSEVILKWVKVLAK